MICSVGIESFVDEIAVAKLTAIAIPLIPSSSTR